MPDPSFYLANGPDSPLTSTRFIAPPGPESPPPDPEIGHFLPETAPLPIVAPPRVIGESCPPVALAGPDRPRHRLPLPPQPNCRLVVRCTPEFRDRVQRLADRKGVSMSQAIEAGLYRLVDDWETSGEPLPRRWESRAIQRRDRIRRAFEAAD